MLTDECKFNAINLGSQDRHFSLKVPLSIIDLVSELVKKFSCHFSDTKQ